jgi:hypothetical protein
MERGGDALAFAPGTQLDAVDPLRRPRQKADTLSIEIDVRQVPGADIAPSPRGRNLSINARKNSPDAGTLPSPSPFLPLSNVMPEATEWGNGKD